MARGWRVLVGWGFLCVAIASLEGIFGPSAFEMAMLAGGGGACMLFGLLSYIGERRSLPPRPDGSEPRALPDLSVGPMVMGLGLGMFFAGWELGPYLMAIGGGTAAVGAANLVREFRAERRERR